MGNLSQIIFLFARITVVPLADYYIIAGVVYQAPDLGTVISSRAVKNYCIILLKISLGLYT